MDIIACMLAYLTCAAGIVGALVLSAFVYFAGPDQPTAPAPTPALGATLGTTPDAAISMNAKPTRPTRATTAAAARPKRVHVAARSAPKAAIHARPPRLARVAADAEPQARLSPAQLRRLAQEIRARRWAYQEDPDFESRFMSYAD